MSVELSIFRPPSGAGAAPLVAGLIAAFCALAAGSACAQDMSIFGYNLNASLRARLGPTYEGSNAYSVGPAGGFSLSKPGSDTFTAADDSASIALFGDERISVGIAGRLRGGRKAQDDLIGLRKVDWAAEAGVFGDLWLTEWLRMYAAE